MSLRRSSGGEERTSVGEGDQSGPVDNGASVLSTIHDVDANQWNNLVTQSDLGSLFHRHEWLAAVEAAFDYDPHHVVVTKDSNPVAIMPNFVSPLDLPIDAADSLASATDLSVLKSGEPGYGGPVVTSNERKHVPQVLDALEATDGHRLLFHRISTHDVEQIRYGQVLASRGYELTTNAAIFLVDLDQPWETILENMDKERRKGIRSAREQDYQVEIDPLGEDLERTYEMYERNTERVGGNTVPIAFFEALDDRLADRVRVFTAVVDGEAVGRYVYLLDPESGILHHWLSAIPDRDCYDYYPAELMHAEAIQWGIDEGYGDYSFDKVGAYYENSVFRFKAKYGGRAEPLLRWERGENRVMWPVYKLARKKQLQNTLDGES